MLTKEDEATAKDRRATRKAAAACLARQRHKSFVNSLQESGSGMQHRVECLKARRGHAVSGSPSANLPKVPQTAAGRLHGSAEHPNGLPVRGRGPHLDPHFA